VRDGWDGGRGRWGVVDGYERIEGRRGGERGCGALFAECKWSVGAGRVDMDGNRGGDGGGGGGGGGWRVVLAVGAAGRLGARLANVDAVALLLSTALLPDPFFLLALDGRESIVRVQQLVLRLLLLRSSFVVRPDLRRRIRPHLRDCLGHRCLRSARFAWLWRWHRLAHLGTKENPGIGRSWGLDLSAIAFRARHVRHQTRLAQDPASSRPSQDGGADEQAFSTAGTSKLSAGGPCRSVWDIRSFLDVLPSPFRPVSQPFVLPTTPPTRPKPPAHLEACISLMVYTPLQFHTLCFRDKHHVTQLIAI
jgi:hypothetical protein